MLLSMAVTLQAATTLLLGAPEVYVDFNAAANGSGSAGSPFNSLSSALGAVDDGGDLIFNPGLTAGMYILGASGSVPGVIYADKAMTLGTTLHGPVSNPEPRWVSPLLSMTLVVPAAAAVLFPPGMNAWNNGGGFTSSSMSWEAS